MSGSPAPTIIPTLRYRDVDKAIDWLTGALGFAAVFVARDDSGQIGHAQLTHGTGMIMLGPHSDGDDDRLSVDMGPAGVYVILGSDEIGAHYERAVAAGAEVVRELRDESYGGTGYAVRDPELNVWSFGTYHPAMG
ncbi:VOC family protein [Planotetraspora sp. GP83]|uniref:VOC family protein n=1 Tax=Planotetraspora sp. GP83 TaxID=3156264 RepID=UPI003518DDE4